MKVLWVGDSPTVSTGFARCTRAACGALYDAGHEVHVLGLSFTGDPHDYPYKIYVTQPRGVGDPMGCRRLPSMVAQLQPDIIVLLQDPWNIDEYFDSMKEAGIENLPPVVAWLAVDAKNHPMSDELNPLAHVVTWTQFAIDELRKGGYTGTASVVPLGVDTSVFKPGDRGEARNFVIGDVLPAGAFVVGVVGRNQPRKRIDLAIDYFAEFVSRYNVPDAYMFLHIAPTGEKSCDIRAVSAYYPSIKNHLFVATPNIGVGLDDGSMVDVYRAFDVLLTTTQGEGWGLPVHEAMACGIPCIVPDWSALGEWPGDAVMKVPCTSTALSAPINLFPYTIGGVPDKQEAVRALWKMYAYKAVRAEYRAAGLALTARPELQWSSVGTAFMRELEAVVARAAEAAEWEEAAV